VSETEFELDAGGGNGILAELDSQGIISFWIAAGDGSPIRGTVMFDRMIDYFGERALAIRGVWRKGQLGHPSTNIDKVNELTTRGMLLDEAITFAWTVTRARRRGFNKVRIEKPPDGAPGAYVRIDVLIER
jgi:hypothetical protein